MIFWIGKNYYLQKFLEECKYVVKEKKIPSYVIDNIDISSPSDSDEEIIIKKIQMENFRSWKKFWWGNFEKKISRRKILMKKCKKKKKCNY